MKTIKYLLVFALVVVIFLMGYEFFNPAPKNVVIWDAVTTQKVIELPDSPYKCKTLVAVIGDNVTFCKLEIPHPIVSGVPMVRGDYNLSTNKIRITQETTNDAIAHELKHYAIACTRKTKDEELCVRSAQKMELELDLIKK